MQIITKEEFRIKRHLPYWKCCTKNSTRHWTNGYIATAGHVHLTFRWELRTAYVSKKIMDLCNNLILMFGENILLKCEAFLKGRIRIKKKPHTHTHTHTHTQIPWTNVPRSYFTINKFVFKTVMCGMTIYADIKLHFFFYCRCLYISLVFQKDWNV
jgi:hypothetical protein